MHVRWTFVCDVLLDSQHATGVLENTDSRNDIPHHQMPFPCSDQFLCLLHHIS